MPEAFEPILPSDAFREEPRKPPRTPSKSGTRRTEKNAHQPDGSLSEQYRRQMLDQQNPGRPRLKLSDFPQVPEPMEEYRDGYQIGSDDEDESEPTYGQLPIDVLKQDREKIAQGKMIEFDQVTFTPGYDEALGEPDDWKHAKQDQNTQSDPVEDLNPEDASRPTLVEGMDPGLLTVGKRYLARLIRRIKNSRKKPLS